MKKTSLFTLFIFFVLSSLQLSAQKITFPEGSFRDSQPEDFEARNLSSKYYNELWTYHINLDNGIQIVYNFSINDFGSFKDRVTGVRLQVSWKDGNTYIANKEYDVSDLIIDPENKYIRVHPNRPFWAKGSFDDEHMLNFQNERDGVLYNLNLTLYDIAKGKVQGNGVYKSGNDEIGMFLMIPHAKVKGFVAINGDTVQAEGTAYMDHIYQNNMSTELINKSHRIKSGDDQNGFFLHLISLSNGSGNPIGYGVQFNNGSASVLTPRTLNTLETTSVRNINLETKLMINCFQMDPLILQVDKHLNTYSIMDELSGFQKFFAKRILGGELIEMNGTLDINDSKKGYFYYMVTDN